MFTYRISALKADNKTKDGENNNDCATSSNNVKSAPSEEKVSKAFAKLFKYKGEERPIVALHMDRVFKGVRLISFVVSDWRGRTFIRDKLPLAGYFGKKTICGFKFTIRQYDFCDIKTIKFAFPATHRYVKDKRLFADDSLRRVIKMCICKMIKVPKVSLQSKMSRPIWAWSMWSHI